MQPQEKRPLKIQTTFQPKEKDPFKENLNPGTRNIVSLAD